MSVTAAQGWQAAGVVAGIKASGSPDLALLVSDRPASVAGAFTASRWPGAHLIVDRPRVVKGAARAVVVNSGIANDATGQAGIDNAVTMAALAAEATGVPAEEMLVCSTGTIGNHLPMERIRNGIAHAAKAMSADGGPAAAQAIMTTDTRPKEAVRTFDVNGVTVTVGGMAKGAGMIAPAMQVAHATMLAFVTTDAVASAATLRRVLEYALSSSFNAITVDGCESPCDTVLLFANGASGVSVEESDAFATAVGDVMADLAYAIVSDGEGAQHVIRIRVTGAASDDEARTAARTVANNILFRAAVWGGDPNWGRISQAIGQSGVTVAPDEATIRIGGVTLLDRGTPTGALADAAAGLKADEVVVEADLASGPGIAEYLTCDLTPEYVQFNADYTT